MSFDEAVKAFLTYCDLERALSPNTLLAYAADLKHFAAFASPPLGPDFQPTQVGRSLIRAFIASQRERGLAVPTIVVSTACAAYGPSWLIAA